MPIKFTTKCSRCRREEDLNVQNVQEATAIEENLVKRAAAAKKIEEFIRSLPEGELPDVLVLSGGKVVSHPYLCDPPEQRSCTARVADLVQDVNTLPERKPRAKKAAAEEAPQ